MKTLYFNGDFVPMTTEDDTFEALLVADDGTIAFTGSLEEARAQAAGCEEIDLEGKAIMPGFIDPHGHFGLINTLLATADLSLCESIDDILDTLRAFLAEHPTDADGVLFGMNYDHNNLAEQRHPTKFDLDKVSSEIPIALMHASVHMMAANTPMLAVVGIDEDSIDPEGARYARVGDTREPDGYIEETAAMLPVYGAATARLNATYDSLLEDMQREYSSRGVTT
ncbi:MAG: amidohydrolase family protein [Raoultibacter sp.]